MKLRNFFADLKRRNVYKVAVADAGIAWLLIQIADWRRQLLYAYCVTHDA